MAREELPQNSGFWRSLLADAFGDLREAILKGDEAAISTAKTRITGIMLFAAAVGAGGFLLA